jgi:hypothetical protein
MVRRYREKNQKRIITNSNVTIKYAPKSPIQHILITYASRTLIKTCVIIKIIRDKLNNGKNAYRCKCRCMTT